MSAPLDVRCVVWDLDGTVWPGTVLDGPVDALPPVDDDVARAMARLEQHGIVNSIASRNPPSWKAAVGAHPVLGACVAPQVGWGWKSDALVAISRALDLPLASFVFVDDDGFERAEVAAAHPEVTVLDRAALLAALEGPGLLAETVTDDGEARVERYRQRERRAAAAGSTAAGSTAAGSTAARSTGDRARFLTDCDIHVEVCAAVPGDAARIAELSVRTSQYNSSGCRYDAADVVALLARDDREVSCFHLRDRFGDEGLVAVAVVALRPGDGSPATGVPATVELLAVSCRAAGHGVVDAVLAVLRRAHGSALVVPVRPTDRNAPLRLALRASGFRAHPAVPAASATTSSAGATPHAPADPALAGLVRFASDGAERSLPAWLTLDHE